MCLEHYLLLMTVAWNGNYALPHTSPFKIIESPRDIWIATEKMRILLLCCLLNNMGFSIEEINNRFKEAPVLLPEAFTFNTPWIDN